MHANCSIIYWFSIISVYSTIINKRNYNIRMCSVNLIALKKINKFNCITTSEALWNKVRFEKFDSIYLYFYYFLKIFFHIYYLLFRFDHTWIIIGSIHLMPSLSVKFTICQFMHIQSETLYWNSIDFTDIFLWVNSRKLFKKIRWISRVLYSKFKRNWNIIKFRGI